MPTPTAFYVTTNAYPWCRNGFAGAQIYALSKAQLAAGAANVTMQHIDTSGMVRCRATPGSTQPGFTVWPAQSPGTGSFETANGGTEYFLSSNAADEATHPVAGTGGNHMSSQIVVWTLTNTSSLEHRDADRSPQQQARVGRTSTRIPPKQRQPGSGTAPGTASRRATASTTRRPPTIAGVGCWRLLFGAEPAHNEVDLHAGLERHPHAAGDVRQRQAVGRPRHARHPSAATTAPASRGTSSSPVVRANARARRACLGVGGADLTYPAIGVTASGRGVMAFTYTDATPTRAPRMRRSTQGRRRHRGRSLARAARAAATDDGFTSYKSQVGNPPRTRWGDYGAAAVDGNSIWIASEYIANACDYTTWGGRFFGATTGDNKLGTCAPSPGAAGPRSGARQLVDAHREAHPLVVSATHRGEGRPKGRPSPRVYTRSR